MHTEVLKELAQRRLVRSKQEQAYGEFRQEVLGSPEGGQDGAVRAPIMDEALEDDMFWSEDEGDEEDEEDGEGEEEDHTGDADREQDLEHGGELARRNKSKGSKVNGKAWRKMSKKERRKAMHAMSPEERARLQERRIRRHQQLSHGGTLDVAQDASWLERVQFNSFPVEGVFSLFMSLSPCLCAVCARARACVRVCCV